MEIPGPGVNWLGQLVRNCCSPAVVEQFRTNWEALTSEIVVGRPLGDAESVSIRHSVPAQLQNGPFTLAQATGLGVTRGQLRGPAYARLSSCIYCWVGSTANPYLLLKAVARRLASGAAFSGHTAAWLHGLDVAPCDPIEVTIPLGSRRRSGLRIRRAALGSSEIVLRRGLPATSAIRTLVDLTRRGPLTEGVVIADLALHARLVTIAELRKAAMRIMCLRRVVDYAEPKTESPMETRLRMLLVLAGLPAPEVQVSIRDDQGHLLGRPDLLYRDQRLAIEYDGGNHRDRLVDDNRRQNSIIVAGFRMLRFTGADVYGTPDRLVLEVRAALRAGIP